MPTKDGFKHRDALVFLLWSLDIIDYKLANEHHRGPGGNGATGALVFLLKLTEKNRKPVV